MADPLSVTAGIVGVVGFALHSAKRLHDFIDSLRDAPHDIAAISKDLKALYEVLGILAGMQHELARNAALCECLLSPLDNCVDIFEEFTITLHRYSHTTREGALKVRTWKQIPWAFKDTEIQRFRDTLLTYKASMSLAISVVNL
jgi:hypothetical protein